MASPETRLKDWTLAHLKARGPHWVAEKRVGSPLTLRGKADVMAFCRGQHGELELKASAKDKTSKLQDHWLQRCAAAGALVAVAYTKEQVTAWADALEALATQRQPHQPDTEH